MRIFGEYHNQTYCPVCGGLIDQMSYAGFDSKGRIRCKRCFKMKNILFVCSANVNRSKAFEREFREILKGKPFKIRSAGIYSSSGQGYKLDEDVLEWADQVFVMTQAHKMFINKHYSRFLDKVHVIGISDEYDVDNGRLREIIYYWYGKVFKKINKL